jgi:hypothetical protein
VPTGTAQVADALLEAYEVKLLGSMPGFNSAQAVVHAEEVWNCGSRAEGEVLSGWLRAFGVIACLID